MTRKDMIRAQLVKGLGSGAGDYANGYFYGLRPHRRRRRSAHIGPVPRNPV